MKNDPGLGSNNFKTIPDSARSNFRIIFCLQDPKTIDFQLKLLKKFKSMPENCQDNEPKKIKVIPRVLENGSESL